MSLADAPKWSNGDKTVTVTLKSNYKWSDGQPVTSRDVLFFFDEIKAAIKENASNWGPYTPNLGIPDEVASLTAPSANTVVFNLKQGGQPAVVLVQPAVRGAADAVARLGQSLRGRSDPGLHQPGEREEDLGLPQQAGDVAVHLHQQPAVADRGRALQADPVQQHHGRVHDGAEPRLRRPARQEGLHHPGRPVHLRYRRVQRGPGRQHRHGLPAADRHQAGGDGQGERLQRVRLSRLGVHLRHVQLPGQDRPLQQHHRPAVLPAGARAPAERARLRQGVLRRRRRPGLRPGAVHSDEPVHPGERGEEPVPVQRGRPRSRC